MPKFCKDCGNYRPANHWADCHAYENRKISLVDGTETCKFSAHHARELESACGKEARWFKPLLEKEDHHEA